MFEFLIKCTEADWFNLNSNEFNKVLHPSSFSYKAISGWGSHRIEVSGCEISFSDEIAGIQVSFEGTISEDAGLKIAEEICHNVVQATGQKGELLQIT
jgi:hypothetical protein